MNTEILLMKILGKSQPSKTGCSYCVSGLFWKVHVILPQLNYSLLNDKACALDTSIFSNSLTTFFFMNLKKMLIYIGLLYHFLCPQEK